MPVRGAPLDIQGGWKFGHFFLLSVTEGRKGFFTFLYISYNWVEWVKLVFTRRVSEGFFSQKNPFMPPPVYQMVCPWKTYNIGEKGYINLYLDFAAFESCIILKGANCDVIKQKISGLPWTVHFTLYPVSFHSYCVSFYPVPYFILPSTLFHFTLYPVSFYPIPCFILPSTLFHFTLYPVSFYPPPCFILPSTLFHFTQFTYGHAVRTITWDDI